MDEKVNEIMEAAGIKDFDELTDAERQSYFKLLEIAQTGKITLEDFTKHIKKMRESVEFSLATDNLTTAQDLFLKARLRTYIIMESFFDRPERAKDMLDQYKKLASSRVK